MSLGLLVPLFLLGLAGVAIPVVVHLTRRRRRDVVRFPSLMFLEKIPYQEQRRRRIRHWALLAMRALAVSLIALAFARPFFEEGVDGAATAGPREVVVLLDRSYSMSAQGRFEAALNEARRVVSELGPLDRASVVAFHRGARVLARSTTDPLALRGALDTLHLTASTTRFGPALKVAQTIVEESDLVLGEIVLISDFQRIAWRGDEGVLLPPGTRLVPVDVGAAAPAENLAVADVTLARIRDGGRERVRATARIVRRGGEAPVTRAVTLEVDGQEIQRRTVEVAPDGVATASFDPFTLSRPHTRGAVRLPPDALPADDGRYFVLSPGQALDVLVVDGAGAPSERSLYLRRALEITLDGRFALRTRRADGVRPSDLEDTDLVILDDVRLDGASAERLRGFVEEGGGVLVVLGERSAWPASAADLLPGRIGTVEDRFEGRGGHLGFLEYAHPVFEPFAGPRSGDFSGARFFRARAFQPHDSAQVLARFDDGSVALAERRVGRGTVAVWTSTLDNHWNDLALQPVFLPFVQRLAEHVGGRVEPQPWLITGRVVDLADPAALERAGLMSPQAAGLVDGSEQVALTPSGATVALPGGEGPRFLELEEAGFYTVRPPGTDPERPFVLAVNVDLEESDPARLDVEALTRQVSPPAAGPEAGPAFTDAGALRRRDQERRQSLWRWILLAALTLLAVETLASNWLSRRRGGGLAGGAAV